MRQNVKHLSALLILLFISFGFIGCSCRPETITIVAKPERPKIPEATIIQCSSLPKGSVLEKQKCVLQNYINVKEELDIYKEVILNITSNPIKE